MRRRVVKFFGFWQHEKEEMWLNHMSMQGWQLASVSLFTYVFRDGQCGEYLYKLEFLDSWPDSAKNVRYIQFLKEMGIQYIDNLGRWAYLRKRAADGPFEMYSDNTSRIAHYKRIITFICIIGGINAANMWNSVANLNLHMELYELYSRRGLWIGLLIFQIVIMALIAVGIISLSVKIRRLRKEQRIRE